MTDQGKAYLAKEPAKPAWLAWLPHLLVASWILFLGASIWQHALHSVKPPYYDPLTYMEKAANFWRFVQRGHLFNPLNLQPSSRPPGTILMSYPFGLTPDFHGFYFRSTFLPILSIVAAIYIVAGLDRIKACGWRVAATALLLSSLPMFYWMDWNESFYGWGMVDTFQAGIAAMAVAAVLRSQMTRSRSWLLFGALLASFTLLVKPSGLMIMALTFCIWFMPIVFERILELRLRRPAPSLRAYAFSSGVIFLFSYAFIIVLCVFSNYLSSGNFRFARQVLVVMRKELVTNSFLPLFHRSSGEWMPLWMIAVSLLIMHQVFVARREDKGVALKPVVLLVAALITWISGAWYWIVLQAGASEIRYFFPFMLMGCMCIVSPALYVWPRIRRPVSLMLLAVSILPAMNMAVLLASGDSPSSRWQHISGVNVSVGGGREEVSQAYAFLEEVRETKKNRQIYFFPTSLVVQSSFALVGDYEKLLRPELASFTNVHPLDWTRGLAVRVSELLSCDCILVNKYSDADVQKNLSSTHIDTFGAECEAFESWIFAQNEQSGLEIVSDGRKLRLLRIADPIALNRAIDQFVATRNWRPEFKAANPPMWWNRDTARNAATGFVIEDVGFGSVYKLHSLAINRIDHGIHIDAWWEELRHDEANNRGHLFFHLIDKSDKIKYVQDIALFPYMPPDNQKRWRHGETTFYEVLPDGNLTLIGFGIRAQKDHFLSPDKVMPSDWKGRRVLIPLRSIPGVAHETKSGS